MIQQNPRSARLRASIMFNPERLSDCITFCGDTPTVDKERLFVHPEDRSLFCTFLNSMLRWDYTSGLDNTTIYFEIADDVIFAGAYDESCDARLTRVPIAAQRRSNNHASYTYIKKDFDRIKKKLTKPSCH